MKNLLIILFLSMFMVGCAGVKRQPTQTVISKKIDTTTLAVSTKKSRLSVEKATAGVEKAVTNVETAIKIVEVIKKDGVTEAKLVELSLSLTNTKDELTKVLTELSTTKEALIISQGEVTTLQVQADIAHDELLQKNKALNTSITDNNKLKDKVISLEDKVKTWKNWALRWLGAFISLLLLIGIYIYFKLKPI